MQYGNLLRLKSDQSIFFVDFEYAARNFRGFDIGNHFYEWCYDYDGLNPHEMHVERYPTKEEQETFLEAYLEAGVDSRLPNHTTLEQLSAETQRYGLLSNVFWGLWAVIQAANSQIHFDYVGYAVGRFEEFNRRKSEVIVSR